MLSPMNLVYNWYNLANIFLPIGYMVLNEGEMAGWFFVPGKQADTKY